MSDRPFKVVFEFSANTLCYPKVRLETSRHETTVHQRSIEGARELFEGSNHWHLFGGPVRIVEIIDSLKSTSS